jgi:hypothetical protein
MFMNKKGFHDLSINMMWVDVLFCILLSIRSIVRSYRKSVCIVGDRLLSVDYRHVHSEWSSVILSISNTCSLTGRLYSCSLTTRAV